MIASKINQPNWVVLVAVRRSKEGERESRSVKYTYEMRNNRLWNMFLFTLKSDSWPGTAYEQKQSIILNIPITALLSIRPSCGIHIPPCIMIMNISQMQNQQCDDDEWLIILSRICHARISSPNPKINKLNCKHNSSLYYNKTKCHHLNIAMLQSIIIQ